MTQDKVVSLIVDMMGVTMKVALPDAPGRAWSSAC